MGNSMDSEQEKKITDEASDKGAMTEIGDEELTGVSGGGNPYKDALEAIGNHLRITPMRKACEKYCILNFRHFYTNIKEQVYFTYSFKSAPVCHCIRSTALSLSSLFP